MPTTDFAKKPMALLVGAGHFQGNHTFQLNRKHKPIITIENYVNFLMTSNVETPFTIETGDRRYWVPAFIRHKVSQDETDKFINDEFKPWLENGGFQLVRDYLEFVDLKSYRSTGAPPMTDSKKELMGFEEDALDQLIAPLVKQNKVVTIEKLKESISNSGVALITDKALSSALKVMGCQQRRSNARRVYITPYGQKSGLSSKSAPKELAQYLCANG